MHRRRLGPAICAVLVVLSAGLGAREASAAPGFVSISAGGAHTCAARADGTVWCWGANHYGQLGSGTSVRRLHCVYTVLCVGGYYQPAIVTVPIQVPNLRDVVEVDAGARHTCARTATGVVLCWGDDQHGALGRGAPSSPNSEAPTPVRLPRGVTARQISAGVDYTCATTGSGRVVCWGLNVDGQTATAACGLPARSCAKPGVVTGVTDVAEVRAGEHHTCARRRDGSVWCWGNASNGQRGTAASGPTPAPISGISNAARLAVGVLHTCAVRRTRSVACWGRASDGELGNGSTTGSSSVPVDVRLPADVLSVSAADTGTCAARADGSVRCWGNGVATPTLVKGLDPVALIDVGHGHACAVHRDGSASCWGCNESGQRGDGRFTTSWAPCDEPPSRVVAI